MYLFSVWYSLCLIVFSAKYISLQCFSQLNTTPWHTSAFVISLPHYYLYHLFVSFLFFVLTDQRAIWLQCPTQTLYFLFTITSSKFNFWELHMYFILCFLFTVSGKWEKVYHHYVLSENDFHKPIALNKKPSAFFSIPCYKHKDALPKHSMTFTS